MKNAASSTRRMTADPGPPARGFAVEGWTIHEYETVTSTNLVAARLPPWSAVRANSQTAGRGRFQRSWISDQGGLWLSAVVPVISGTPEARTLPLAIGAAVCGFLGEFGLASLRMRWPNDILVEDRKLAGLLVDQFVPDTAVAGIGVNVFNDPEREDSSLRNMVARLAEFMPSVPPLDALTTSLLRHIKTVLDHLHEHGQDMLIERVNRLWGKPRLVELDLHPGLRRGTFTGVDREGRLSLVDASGVIACFNPSQVHHLAEL